MSFLYPFATLTFAYPWVFLLPILSLFAFLTQSSKSKAVIYGSLEPILSLPVSWRNRLRTPVLGTLAGAAIVFLAIAAARPQRVTISQTPREARNLMLSLDTSRSMANEDIDSPQGRLSRIEAVKAVVSQFIDSRVDDRIGLVVFGNSAYLQSPLTLDHTVVSELVRQMELGMAGDGTALGDGLGLALKRLQDLPGYSKAIVLLTDGVSNSGQVNPLKAAEVAREMGVKVHTIGVGSTHSVASVRSGFFSQRQVQQAEYDEKTLRAIAEKTGGVFFNASTMEGLQNVYASIDQLEKSQDKQPQQKIVEELFIRYAEVSLIALLLYLLLARTVFRKVP